MYLLMALFLRHFIIVINCYFHAFGETIADFDAVFIEDLMGGVGFEKNAYQVDLENICLLLWIHFYWKGD